MPCVQHKDGDGCHWIVNRERDWPRIDVWWNRSSQKWDGKAPAEGLVLRQQNLQDGAADVIVLTLGMVYDLIDALNLAVENP